MSGQRGNCETVLTRERIGSRGGCLWFGVIFDSDDLVVVSVVDGFRVYAVPSGFEGADQCFCFASIVEGFCVVFGGVHAVDDGGSPSSMASCSGVRCSVRDAGSPGVSVIRWGAAVVMWRRVKGVSVGAWPRW